MFPCQGGQKRLLYWLTLVSGFLESLFFTGIVLGWASVVFALKADGYFSGYCVNATKEGNHTVNLDCSSQDQHLTQVMSVAFIFNTLSRLPIGYIFDRYGTTVTRLIAVSLYTMGTLLVSLSNTDMSEVLYPAFSCILISGGMLYLTNAQVGNLFETHRSTIITVYNGAYDSSALVFLVIKLLYERGVSLQSSFLFLSLCGVLHLLRTLFLMPTGHIPYLLPENYTYGLRCPGQRTRKGKEDNGKQAASEPQAEVNLKSSKAEDKPSALDAAIKPAAEKIQEEVVSFKSCVFSWLFFWHLLWVATIHTCHLVLITNLNPTLNRLANNDQNLVSHYTNIFAIIQLCGVVLSPLNGCIIDRHKRKPLAQGKSMREADLHSLFLALLLTSLQCFILCVCFTCPILPLQYVTFVLQVVNSAFLYGGHQSFITLAFPAIYFGKLSGTAMLTASLGMLLQLPLPFLIQHQLQDDPFCVYMGITLVSLLSFLHPVHVNLYCRSMAKQRVQKSNE